MHLTAVDATHSEPAMVHIAVRCGHCLANSIYGLLEVKVPVQAVMTYSGRANTSVRASSMCQDQERNSNVICRW